MTDNDQPVQRWSIDKHIPVALILSIVIQTAGIIWWASSITARVDALERSLADSRNLPERIARVEGFLTSINDTLSRIDRKLDQRGDK